MLGPFLEEGESLLDVGCGGGTLGAAIAAAHRVSVTGLETEVREGCAIPVAAYEGGLFPGTDNSVDTVLIADVLHHEPEPERILREAQRVARKQVIVKDHKVGSFLAWPRIALIDWAANAGYGVPCLFEYPDLAGWHGRFERTGLRVENEWPGIDLYPIGLNLLFGKALQYMAVLAPADVESS